MLKYIKNIGKSCQFVNDKQEKLTKSKSLSCRNKQLHGIKTVKN